MFTHYKHKLQRGEIGIPNLRITIDELKRRAITLSAHEGHELGKFKLGAWKLYSNNANCKNCNAWVMVELNPPVGYGHIRGSTLAKVCKS